MCNIQQPERDNLSVSLSLGFLLFAFMILFVPSSALGALGGNVSSVQADQVHMQGSLRIKPTDGYAVHEIQAPTGTVVREYVSPAGTVFAIAWQGPWLPDLTQLLGSHFDEYAQAVQAQANDRAGRRPLHIELPGLIVDLAGRPRSFAGRAYIPEMVPQGHRAEEIR